MMSFFVLTILFVVPLIIAVTVYGMSRKNPRLRRRSLFLRIAALTVFVGGLATVTIGTIVSQNLLYAELRPFPDIEIMLPHKEMTAKEIEDIEDEVYVLLTLVLIDNEDNVLAAKQCFSPPLYSEEIQGCKITFLQDPRGAATRWTTTFLRETIEFEIEVTRVDVYRQPLAMERLSYFEPCGHCSCIFFIPQHRSSSSIDINRLAKWPLEALSHYSGNYPLVWYSSVVVNRPEFRRLALVSYYRSKDDLCTLRLSEWFPSYLQEASKKSDYYKYKGERKTPKWQPASVKYYERFDTFPAWMLIPLIIIGGFAARRFTLGVAICFLVTIACLISLEMYLLNDNLARITADGNILQRTQAVRQCDTTFFFKDTALRELKKITDVNDLPAEVRKEIDSILDEN